MTTSLRDLGRRVDSVTAPHLDVATLIAAGDSQIRRRRLAVVAAATAAVVAVVGGAVLVTPDTHRTAPAPARPDHDDTDSDTVRTGPAARLLTYAVGTTIHWGDRTIHVGKLVPPSPPGAGRRRVGYVDATDAGAVFIIGQPMVRDSGGLGLPYGPASVWFTDGSAPVRIGTTSGSAVRGFGIAPATSGSTLAWIDPGTTTVPAAIVVYDTAHLEEIGRVGDAGAVPLAVYDDVVYWSPDGNRCERYLPTGAAYGCPAAARVMRFDTRTGQQTLVSAADYDSDRRSRPGLLAGESDDPQIRRGVTYLSFVRRGSRLVAVGTWDASERPFPSTVSRTGDPLRLRLPATGSGPDPQDGPQVVPMVQWLDPDQVVVLDHYSDSYADGAALVICRLSTGDCREAVRVDAGLFIAPGPVLSHG